MNALEFSAKIGSDTIKIDEVNGLNNDTFGEIFNSTHKALSQIDDVTGSLNDATTPFTNIFSATQGTISTLDSMAGN